MDGVRPPEHRVGDRAVRRLLRRPVEAGAARLGAGRALPEPTAADRSAVGEGGRVGVERVRSVLVVLTGDVDPSVACNN